MRHLRLLAVLGFALAMSAPAAAAPGDPWPGVELPGGGDVEAFIRGWGRDLTPAEAERAANELLAQGEGEAAIEATAYLMRGLARYRLGHYPAAARDLYRARTGPVHNPDLAAFFEAEARFHDGDYARAQSLFRRLKRKHPHSVWRHRAQVRIADCRVAQGEYARAISGWKGVLKTYPEFPHMAAMYFAISEAERLRGRVKSAAEWLARIDWEMPEEPMNLVARRQLKALAAQGGEPAELSVDETIRRAKGLRKRRYYRHALDTLQPLLTDPRANAGQRWKARYQIARALYQLERFEEAYTSFAALAADARGTQGRRYARLWKAYSLERLGRLDAAAAALFEAKGCTEEKPTAEALYKVGWLYFDAARYDRAAELFGRVAKLGGTWARKTHWHRAWLAYRLGDYKTAASAFKRLHATSRRRAERHGYWLARTLVHMGELDAAADTYRGVIDQAPLSYYAYQSRARLEEIGRPLLLEPDAREAPEETEAAGAPPAPGLDCVDGDERPGCRLLAAEAPVLRPEGSPEVSPEAAADVPGATEGEEAPVFIVQKPVVPDAVQILSELTRRWGGALPGVARAYELAVIGEGRLAMHALRPVSNELRAFYRSSRGKRSRWAYVDTPAVDNRKLTKPRGEWDRVISEKGPRSSRKRIKFLSKRRDPAFWPLLRDAFAAVGDHYYAYRHARKEDKVSGRPEQADNRKWRRRYARAFQPLVEQNARHYGLDPHFIWALMTVESRYNAWAISRASARGLMQVMPQTGALVAGRMQWRNFGPALLFEPEFATEMAAWYFHQLLRKFNGQLPLAIASYNAGPHRVAAWLTRKGHLPMDEFVEEIPYVEAREYTKKVLGYLALYRRIYQGDDALRVGQVIDPGFGDNINF